MPKRVLVFVVAYRAERHLVAVFERIPNALLCDPQVDFLIIDDASGDGGPDLLAEHLRRRNVTSATILRNLENQGYGGNQKLGYRYAIDNGYGFVILLHGDGQYAPELLPRFIEAWRRTGADVVLGSRMAEPRAALRGGMPVYKWLGNRILTGIQNRLTGLGLSEYHTGYRGYSTDFLQRVPFEINTNDFHFDTEILLQAAYVGARIREFAIPTHYGEEVCHVSGIPYAFRVLASTLRYRFHRMGMLCSLRYRHLREDPYASKVDIPYSSHRLALEEVRKRRPRRLLDIGCGPGHVARRCREMGVHVTGADRREPPPGATDRFLETDLERSELPFRIHEYDMVLMLDVIEHFSDPERLLLRLRETAGGGPGARRAPVVLLTTPNVAFLPLRINLLLGRFSYAERGILDIDHKRLFTKRSLLTMLEETGYEVVAVKGVPAPFEAVLPGPIGRFLNTISSLFASIRPSLFAFQILVCCRPRPGLRAILDASELHLEAGTRAREQGRSTDDAR